ncbi:hypothetical protein NHX12_005520 [Muraenolepis orangiensis]|uniref:RING-type domain-containing protein n=1 Tax=Muraenolepis orangiensis TaxID=630683 RepID=A0A9Q0IC31_9TELE|nr:hypothetical protein NHX12_005520 [Muraenolepis orangiensis]
MAVRSSSITITLPMSCQICLGKVRQPVICPNRHVFCSRCLDTWLQTVSQCPSCRVPITAETPCRALIGGSSEDVQSKETIMRLRKTRGQLLLGEYEDEIERLLQENEELKSEVGGVGEVGLLDAAPCSSVTSVTPTPTGSLPDQRTSDLQEQLSLKLKCAAEVCSKVTEDMERLKQTNKMLRSQNVDLVTENMNLRAEVSNRSPQKFSRYTVAALEATIQQNEWKMKQLTKALEQSDRTIERLQVRLRGYEGSPPGLWQAPDDQTETQELVMLRRSLSDTERQSICSNPEGQTLSSEGQSLNFQASLGRSEGEKTTGFTATTFYGTPPKLKPSTPSSAFCSLSLRSPKAFRKAGTSLRKLSFEDPPEMVSSTASQMENLSPNLPIRPAAETAKTPFWSAWQGPKSNSPPADGPISEDAQMVGVSSSAAAPMKSGGSHSSSEAFMDAAYHSKVSELDCMMWDSDSSCSQGSRLALGASPAACLDAPLVPQPAAAPAASRGAGKEEHGSLLSRRQNQPPCDLGALDTLCKVGPLGERSAGRGDAAQGGPGPAASLESGRGDCLWSGKEGGDRGGDDSLGSDGATDLGAGPLQGIAAGLGGSWPGGVPVPSVVEGEGLSQTDELSFDILFDSSLDGPATASGSDEPAILPHDSQSSSSSSASDRQLLSIGPTKRKSHSPFNANSPTKLSKLV